MVNLSIDVLFGVFLISLSVNLGNAHIAGKTGPPKDYMRSAKIPAEEIASTFWNNQAQDALLSKISVSQNRNKAKNAIFFLGDGMSIPTLMAARTYLGQLEGQPGEEASLSFELFPVTGLVKTYCVDSQVADSACTATAYLGGVKNNIGTIGVTANVTRGDCEAQAQKVNQVSSIAQWALDAGFEAGFVTTTPVTDASPGGMYAHIAERKWENDGKLPAGADEVGCVDISKQLIHHEPGRRFKVIMGGGREHFLPSITTVGLRQDGENLLQSWADLKSETKNSYSYVTNREELLRASEEVPDYLMGLFQDDYLEYHLLAEESQPTLEEMTEAAIRVLSKSNKGFFLFVEGGRIDTAHHANNAKLALDETVELSKAVARAVELTSSEDTLIVVSSDHAHTMSVSGYPARGNDILAAVDDSEADDGLPIMTLSYANGPGFRSEVDGFRVDVTLEDGFVNRDPEWTYPGTAPLSSETHGGDDVAVFASGPWEHLFSGHYEQHLIPHLIAHAMCLGDNKHENC